METLEIKFTIRPEQVEKARKAMEDGEVLTRIGKVIAPIVFEYMDKEGDNVSLEIALWEVFASFMFSPFKGSDESKLRACVRYGYMLNQLLNSVAQQHSGGDEGEQQEVTIQ